jgi:hypothetical protein
MWETRRDIRKKILQKQQELYVLVKQKGIQHPDVYSKSCELDSLVVEYMKKYNNCVDLRFFDKSRGNDPNECPMEK